MPQLNASIRKSLLKHWNHRKLTKAEKARVSQFYGELAEEEIESECNKCDYYLT